MAQSQSQANAIAKALSISRSEAVVMQINYVVREITGAREFSRILDIGIVKNRWVSEVSVEAFDDEGLVWAQIVMKVDWDRHTVNLSRHGKNVAIDESLPEGEQISWVIGEMVRWFNGFKENSKLQTRWLLTYTDEVRNSSQALAEARMALGTKAGTATKFASKDMEVVLQDRPTALDELTVELRAAKL